MKEDVVLCPNCGMYFDNALEYCPDCCCFWKEYVDGEQDINFFDE